LRLLIVLLSLKLLKLVNQIKIVHVLITPFYIYLYLSIDISYLISFVQKHFHLLMNNIQKRNAYVHLHTLFLIMDFYQSLRSLSFLIYKMYIHFSILLLTLLHFVTLLVYTVLYIVLILLFFLLYLFLVELIFPLFLHSAILMRQSFVNFEVYKMHMPKLQ